MSKKTGLRVRAVPPCRACLCPCSGISALSLLPLSCPWLSQVTEQVLTWVEQLLGAKGVRETSTRLALCRGGEGGCPTQRACPFIYLICFLELLLMDLSASPAMAAVFKSPCATQRRRDRCQVLTSYKDVSLKGSSPIISGCIWNHGN